MARVRKSFRTCFLSSASTCMVHYLPLINYHWSKKFIRKAFPIWMLQKSMQWSCMNSLLCNWMSCYQCWKFWNTFHNKGSSYICSHRLYSISACGIIFPPRKVDIRRSKNIYISNTRNMDISLLVGLWQVYQLLNSISQCPPLTLIFCHKKMVAIRKENSSR